MKIRKGASTAIVAVLFIVGIIIGAGAIYASGVSSSTKTTTATSVQTTTVAGSGATVTQTVTSTASGSSSGLTGTITIGVLSDLSDGLSSEGLRVQSYTEQAATDINTWLQTTQWAGKVTFKVDVIDYAGSTTTALTDLSSLQQAGAATIVGPLSSGIVGAIYKQAASDQIVLISPSSTSPAYYGVSPYLYRTAPNDVFQGQADATMMLSQGVKGVIIVYRDDSYGDGLYNYTSADFNSGGGSSVTVDAIPYSTSLAGSAAFSGIAGQINTDYSNLVAKYGADSVAVDAISFEEIGYLLTYIHSSYPSLLTTPQPWYGTDGEQGDTALTNSTYGSYMQSIRMTASVFGYTNSSKTAAVCADFAGKPSLSCDSYALGSYDDVWLAALSILDCGANSGSCVSKVLPTVADSYYGATGWTQLTTPTGVGGDRAGGDFQLWSVASGSQGLNWYLAGQWSSLDNTVTWLPGMQPAT